MPRGKADVDSDLMTTREAGEFLGLSRYTLPTYRDIGTGPVYIKIGRAVRYRREDLVHYLRTKKKHGHAKPRTS